MPRFITNDLITHPNYFTNNPRYLASSCYFADRDDVVLQNEITELRFPGESIIGCINEIHIHVQLENDIRTINLFNFLNFNGLKLIKNYIQQIEFSNNIFPNDSSINLFEKANGEWNNDGSIYRVGNLPKKIKSIQEYIKILNTFRPIPHINDKNLELESSVYFWTRLRGKSGNLRVEFRPMEMGKDWIERVSFLYIIIKEFVNSKS